MQSGNGAFLVAVKSRHCLGRWEKGFVVQTAPVFGGMANCVTHFSNPSSVGPRAGSRPIFIRSP